MVHTHRETRSYHTPLRLRRREAEARANERYILRRRKPRARKEGIPRDPPISDIESDVDGDADFHASRITIHWPGPNSDRSLLQSHGDFIEIFAHETTIIPAK